jgi:hypothetical protein
MRRLSSAELYPVNQPNLLIPANKQPDGED